MQQNMNTKFSRTSETCSGNYSEAVICVNVMTLIPCMSLLVPIHLRHHITQLLVVVLM